MKTKPKPHLLVSHAEAERVLEGQIHLGNTIQVHGLSVKGQVDSERQLEDWEAQTEQLLLAMFDTSEIAQGFAEAAGLYRKTSSGPDNLTHIVRRVNYKIYALQDIKNRLHLYAERPPKKVDMDIWSLIHPTIANITRGRFESEHYADAVEAALKHINTVVKEKVKKQTGRELDGASLMNTAFTVNDPILALGDITTETGKNIQQGFMQIFAGAMTGIRNPKAHSIVSINQTEAIHFLFLASLLMYKIDQAT